MANIEHGEAPSSAQQLQEAGKMVVGAAGAWPSTVFASKSTHGRAGPPSN